MTVITYGATMKGKSIVSTIIRVPLHSEKHPGKFAIIDEEFAGIILPLRWNVVADGPNFYAVNVERIGKRPNRTTKTTRMHRLILGVDANTVIDHIDGDGLNNTIANLRVCTVAENTKYRRVGRSNTSGYIGVSFAQNPRLTHHWKATIRNGGKNIHLGYFPTAIDAALAYDAASRSMRGDFSRVNFPREGERSAQR